MSHALIHTMVLNPNTNSVLTTGHFGSRVIFVQHRRVKAVFWTLVFSTIKVVISKNAWPTNQPECARFHTIRTAFQRLGWDRTVKNQFVIITAPSSVNNCCGTKHSHFTCTVEQRNSNTELGNDGISRVTKNQLRFLLFFIYDSIGGVAEVSYTYFAPQKRSINSEQSPTWTSSKGLPSKCTQFKTQGYKKVQMGSEYEVMIESLLFHCCSQFAAIRWPRFNWRDGKSH